MNTVRPEKSGLSNASIYRCVIFSDNFETWRFSAVSQKAPTGAFCDNGERHHVEIVSKWSTYHKLVERLSLVSLSHYINIALLSCQHSGWIAMERYSSNHTCCFAREQQVDALIT